MGSSWELEIVVGAGKPEVEGQAGYEEPRRSQWVPIERELWVHVALAPVAACALSKTGVGHSVKWWGLDRGAVDRRGHDCDVAARRHGAVLSRGATVLALAACGASASPTPPGPDLVGLPLTKAEAVLTRDHLGYSEFLESGPLSVGSDGRTIRTGWIVCSETYVNSTNVGLSTKKRSC